MTLADALSALDGRSLLDAADALQVRRIVYADDCSISQAEADALFKLNALFLALLAASLYVASIFYDQSFDGRWYHQEGVIQLNRGFDPFRQTLDENSLPGHVWSIASTRMPMSSSPLWINHYPKGSEIVAASIFALRMGMEAAKGFNFLLLASAILLTYGTFLEYWPGRHRTAALLAAAIGLNPVVVGQLWSNYNDGQLYLLLVGLACALSLHHREGSRRWLVLAGLGSI